MQASGELFNTFEELSLQAESLDDVEAEAKRAYRSFLRDMGYPQAAKNFDALLHEKSGAKFRRDDGTINWLHEFIPITMMIMMARIGREAGGFDLEALDIHGGLESWIISHERHDSVEDATTQKKLINEMERMNREILLLDPSLEAHVLDSQTRQSLLNIDFMTQKIVKLNPIDEDYHGMRFYAQKHDGEMISVDPDGKIYERPDGDYAKEDVVIYTGRMVYDPESNPGVVLGKMLDTTHNFSTMFSPKFTPAKRLKRCNEREDMWGSRNGFPEAAQKRWPEFAEAIKTMDAHLGWSLYHHFGLLQNVDRFHKNPYMFPVGITKYQDNMFRLKMPRLLDVRQDLVKNTMKFVDPETDPLKYARLCKYMERRFIPALGEHKDKFPYLCDSSGRMVQPTPAPVAF